MIAGTVSAMKTITCFPVQDVFAGGRFHDFSMA